MLRNTLRIWRSGVRGLVVVCLFVTLAPSLTAQTAGTGALTGTVTYASGAVVANAMVTATSVDTGQVRTATTGTDGTYRFNLLVPGNYRVRFEAAGFKTVEIPSATVNVTETAVLDRKLEVAAQTNNNTTAASADNTATPSLQDLGISPDQAQGNAQDQARLDKRAHMLKIHQRLGLITIAPLLATIITSPGAAGKHSSATGRDLHGVLGLVTTDMYFTTAYFAIRAPKVPGTETRGPIRLHKTLAWIHGPGMILTPILGAMAYEQLNRGEKIHGIAKAHSAVAAVTYSAFGAAVLSVSVKF
jgi:Carboxypeptidase regulatory-like domain